MFRCRHGCNNCRGISGAPRGWDRRYSRRRRSGRNRARAVLPSLRRPPVGSGRCFPAARLGRRSGDRPAARAPAMPHRRRSGAGSARDDAMPSRTAGRCIRRSRPRPSCRLPPPPWPPQRQDRLVSSIVNCVVFALLILNLTARLTCHQVESSVDRSAMARRRFFEASSTICIFSEWGVTRIFFGLLLACN